MEDLQSRRHQALAAHIEGLEAALGAAGSDETFASVRRLTRSLARAAAELGWSEVVTLAQDVQGVADPDLRATARGLLDFLLAAPGAAAARSGTDLSDHTVLLVEDNRTVATAISAYLKHPRRTLLLAATGAEAEAALFAQSIDLVILDLILPDRDGRDLLLALREEPATAGIPVIVLSAKGGAVTRAECLAVGASEFLEKPADPTALRDAVARLVADHRRDLDALVDSATGLASRAGLNAAYRAIRSRTGKVEGPLAVALLRLRPAQVSEVGADEAGVTLDHLVGEAGERLAVGLADRDRLGRWSDSELVALLPGTNPTEAKLRIESAWRASPPASGENALHQGVPPFDVSVTTAEPGADLRDVVEAAGLSIATPAPVSVPGSDRSPRPAGPPRVLLVEDDRVTATLIQHRLVREGFEVMDFLNGEDAYGWAAHGEFDVAILDVKVPGMDGFELLQRFRATPRLDTVPVVMLTSLGRESDVVRGLELGANDYMLKPFSPNELIARVRRLVLEGWSARARAQTTETP